MCWHLPIFTPRRQSTIFGTTELNFCVRYGNRWTLSVINTNYLFSTTNMILSHNSAFVNSFFKLILRQHRTIRVCGLRSQIFRQNAQIISSHTDVWELIFGQSDGIICKQGVHRELCGIALIFIVTSRPYVRPVKHCFISENSGRSCSKNASARNDLNIAVYFSSLAAMRLYSMPFSVSLSAAILYL